MTSFDSHANFAQSTIAVAPSPAISGTSLSVLPTTGSAFPTAPFNATLWPNGSIPSDSTAEIVRVTGLTGDVFTIVRAQEGTTAQAVTAGYAIAATATVKTLTDIESTVTSNSSTLNAYLATTTGPAGAANTTAQTTLSSLVIPGNQISAGQAYKIQIFGTYTTTGTPTLTFKAMYGGTSGTVLATTPTITTPSGASAYPFTCELTVFFPSTTTAFASLKTTLDTTASTTGTGTGYLNITNPSSLVAVNTTASESLEIDVVWGTANASNAVLCYGIVQRLV